MMRLIRGEGEFTEKLILEITLNKSSSIKHDQEKELLSRNLIQGIYIIKDAMNAV